MKIIEDIKKYVPYNAQEEKDKELILNCLLNEKNIFSRENTLCHMTASSWILNKEHTKVLMIYHNLYDSFTWTGGHADSDTDLLNVAIKEAKEETGIKDVKPISEDIYSLEVLTVDGHIKKGQYVSSHLHLNITYLLEADDTQEIRIKEDENKDVKWLTIEESLTIPNEKWFKERIYPKLNAKINTK